MPLSTPAARERRHHRRIDLYGYAREDGLWDIEGHLTDVKGYDFDNSWRGRITAGTPVHDMWVRLTIDDSMTIRAVEAAIDAGPHRICPDITPEFGKIEGERIAPGWHRRLRQLFGGVNGCVHLSEILGTLGTVAYQTVGPSRAGDAAARAEGKAPRRKPARIDSCHAFRSDGALVKERWPEFYTGS